MLSSVRDLTAQPGCGGRKDDKVCRSRGGESCAFDGAMIVLQPIADAAHVVHGPIACLGNSWQGRGSLSRQGVLDRVGLTTCMTELDIIYGSEGKLRLAICEAARRTSPKAVFVYSTCVSGLTGEDIEAVARECAAELSLPVIPVLAPGFVGPKNLGNRIAGEVLLDHVIGHHVIGHGIGTGREDDLAGAEINLIGEYNIAGDLWLVDPLLKEAGVRVLARITGDANYEEITRAHHARLNVIVCSRALINVAQGMEQRWGIPYIEASFYGPTETTAALRAIARALGDRGIMDKVEEIAAREEARVRSACGAYGHMRGKKAVLYTGGVKSWSMVSALGDLGLELVAVGTKKSSAEDEEKMRRLLGPSAPLEENVTPANLLKLMRERGAELMVAGGRNLYLGAKEGFPFVDVNQERHTAYAGYEGFLNLAADIDSALRFYGRSGTAASGESAECAARIEEPGGSLCMNPLRHSSSIGAAMAFQGVDGALPMLHGAQGCTFLGKVLLTRHFREPIALVGTKVFAEDVVMGSEERLAKAVAEAAERQRPSVIGILTTGLVEVRGEDTAQAARGLARSLGASVVHVPTPDYEGGLEDGYARAVSAMIRGLVPDRRQAPGDHSPDNRRINILAGPHLTPEDFNELKEMAGLFGLDALVLPDLSALDGGREGFSPLARGGFGPEAFGLLGGSCLTLAIGGCMEAPAAALMDRTGVPYRVFRGLTGLSDSDAFIGALRGISGGPEPREIARRRRILSDSMRDAYPVFGRKRICLALEPSHAEALSRLIGEMGGATPLAVIPQRPPHECGIRAGRVVVGDLSCVEGEAEGGFDLIVSNSHAVDTARSLGAPLYQAGFPAYGVFGGATRPTVGHRGTLSVLCEMADRLMEGRT